MYETVVTIVGWICGELMRRRTGDDVQVVSFRMRAQERRYDADTGEWSDGERMFLSVHCWRTLGQNVAASLKRGDPVVVTGRLYHREHLAEGKQRLSVELDARSVGPDLSRCAVTVSREETAAA
ncbi:single-stranded DNA-binding protein [Actinokineospora xionganensis]|uniref:Single-stranded DNA-binding protein n=1 Tax=Actinokineospora xionganensis TaxID=2684470 RepID=A0ABR7L9S6_9PSEU|nr:single-stranded DNA-binding protein [Actinokineospora xionganensis]MBC6449443.1 single-stranded DNA-binding protein [Actinokineospora xionganensis]